MVINFQSVNQNEDHIRISFDVAKFFIANFHRVKNGFCYVKKKLYICITKILFITPNNIYESK